MAESRAFIVTGGNAGLGFQCASFLSADRENLIVLACRDPASAERAAQALRRNGGKVEVLALDLSSQASVRAFVDAFRERRLPPLAGLICNAGGQNIGAPARTAEGYEWLCHVAVPRARSVGASGIVRPRDRRPPRGHRRSAKHAVRLGRGEMALDVEGIVDGGVCGKKFLG